MFPIDRAGSAAHLLWATRDLLFAWRLVWTLILVACGGGSGDAGPKPSAAPTSLEPTTVTTSERRQAGFDSISKPAPEASAPVRVPSISILAQPQGVVVASGQTAIFSVAASGTGPLTYQWRIDDVEIAGATGRTYTTRALSLGDSDSVYSVIVSNSEGRVTSVGAKLTVDPQVTFATAPSITSQPRHQSVLVGQAGTFVVMVESSATPAYQWHRNRVPIPGATAATYSTPPSALTDNGSRFSVVVHSGPASTTSAEARLTVTTASTASSNLDRHDGLVGPARRVSIGESP